VKGPRAVRWDGVTSGSSARVIAQEGEDALFEAAFRTGDFDAASRRLQEAQEAAQSSGDTRTEAFVIDRLGMVAHYRNIMRLIDGVHIVEADMAAEEALFRRALEMREALGDVAGAAQSLFGVGLVHQVLRGDWPTAMGYYTQAFSLAGEAGTALDLYSRSEIHRHLGFYFMVQEVDLEKAIDHLSTSLELREGLGDERLLPSALVALGQAEAAAGNRRRAIELLERAVACARSARLSAPWRDDAEQALADTLGGPGE
jgi:tetratricopeptide (TPR) repeat protein